MRAGESDHLWWGGEGDLELSLLSKCPVKGLPLAHTSLRADESSDFCFNVSNHLVLILSFQLTHLVTTFVQLPDGFH